MNKVLVIPLPSTNAGVQAAINAAVGGGTLVSVATLIGPFDGQPAGQNGLMLVIVFR